jgi:hypothetical protein
VEGTLYIQTIVLLKKVILPYGRIPNNINITLIRNGAYSSNTD